MWWILGAKTGGNWATSKSVVELTNVLSKHLWLVPGHKRTNISNNYDNFDSCNACVELKDIMEEEEEHIINEDIQNVDHDLNWKFYHSWIILMHAFRMQQSYYYIHTYTTTYLEIEFSLPCHGFTVKKSYANFSSWYKKIELFVFIFVLVFCNI